MEYLLLGAVFFSIILAVSFAKDVIALRPKDLQLFIIFGICSGLYLYIIQKNGLLDTVKDKWLRLALLLLPLTIGKIFFGIRYRFFRKTSIKSAMTMLEAACNMIGLMFVAFCKTHLSPKKPEDFIAKYANQALKDPSKLVEELVAHHTGEK